MEEESIMEDIVYFYPQGHEAHFEHGHPERPERIEAVRGALEDAGWWEDYPHLEPLPLSLDFIGTVHEPAYLALLRQASSKGMRLDMDTYTTPASWQLALNAAGGGVAVARAVWTGESKSGFALTRPPGHHATPSRGMGFCLLNNISIAAEYLIHPPEKGMTNAKRLAIVDLDLHHGNGTQEIFWQRDDVLYISTHQSPLYPGSGAVSEIGAGPGLRYTANIPFPPFTGDEAFLTVMDVIILPLIERYKPEMILVSLGFDSHWCDPLGNLGLCGATYGSLISSLTGWAERNCGGKIALFLEGGYDLDAGRSCAQGTVAALLKKTWTDSLGPSPHRQSDTWKHVLSAARRIWDL
jgi:acetoin utilization deacetylase AcuC-like enzyme